MAPEAAAVCAPYQKHATMARTIAGKFAPQIPKDARARTGNGTPVRTPATPTSCIRKKMMSEPMPMARRKFMKLPQKRNRLAAR